jgi:hypothetical protein
MAGCPLSVPVFLSRHPSEVMDDLINKGGPVEVEVDYTDAVEAHVIP